MLWLVTGANRGVGLALAAAVARRGDSVIATARRPEAAADLAALAAETGRIEIAPADVTDAASLATLAARLEGRALDVLVANAGVYEGEGRLGDPSYSRDAWAATLLTNVYGVYACAEAFAPALGRAKAGKIAVIASAMGSTAAAIDKGGEYAYRASKAAAVNLARNLAADLRPRGVAVGAYHPGWVRTDMGGAGADLAPEESAAGLLARIDALTLAGAGPFEDWRGRPVAF